MLYLPKGAVLMVITISRQFASGGHEIGQKLAKKLGFKFYDKELIYKAAEMSGISPDILKEVDEKAASSLLYSLSLGASSIVHGFSGTAQLPINDRVFIAQQKLIKEYANSDCIIVGRCADYVLKDNKNCIKIFIYADFDFRRERAINVEGIDKNSVNAFIAKKDKTRANYYNYYADIKWGDYNNYDLCINSAFLGIDGTTKLIEEIINIKKK